ARQRERPHRRRLLEPRPRLVRQPRDCEDRADHHRQRLLLPLQRLRRRPEWCRTSAHEAIYAQAQREGRALQPHPRRRVPLRENLDIRAATRKCARDLERSEERRVGKECIYRWTWDAVMI